jgi:hypothetical protein
MKNRFNLTRYLELIEKENALAYNKSLFSENRCEFIELLDYGTTVERQIKYDRKNDYFLLIDNYLQKLISLSNFWSELLEMEKEDYKKPKKFCSVLNNLPF